MLGRPTARLLKSAEASLPRNSALLALLIEMPDEEAPAARYPSVPDEFACRICLESDQTPDDPLIAVPLRRHDEVGAPRLPRRVARAEPDPARLHALPELQIPV